MAALVSVLVLCVMDVLMGVLFALVSVGMLVLIIIMATHLDSPPFLCALIHPCKIISYLILSDGFFGEIHPSIKRRWQLFVTQYCRLGSTL
jgi:hypothetical protein